MEKTIIDLSYANGTVNFDAMKNSAASANPIDIDGAYIKVNEGCGPAYVDTQLQRNIAGCQKNGYKFGYYHFATLNMDADAVGDAKREADYFLSLIKPLPSYTLVPAIDIETNTGNLPPDHVEAWLNTFISEIKNGGIPDFCLYSYTDFFNRNLPIGHSFGNYKLWIAQYTTLSKPNLPKGWGSYYLWQHSSTGRIPGIGTNVDFSRYPPIV